MGDLFDDLPLPDGDASCQCCHPPQEVNWTIGAAAKIRRVQRQMIRASVTRSTWLRRKCAQETLGDLDRLIGDDYSVGFILEGTAFLKNFRDALEWLAKPTDR